jgi:DNA-binding transcriptional LysR family regulator
MEKVAMALNFDLNDLLAFRAVAELGNFRRAAEAVHISQPAFSRRIDKLEQALGVRLLERTTRRVSLTAVGRDFARKVASCWTTWTARCWAARHLAHAHGRGHGGLRAVDRVLLPVAGDPALPRALPEDPRARARRRRQRGAGRGGARRGRLRPELHRQPGARDRVPALAEERFVAACRRDHPLARKRRVTWADLAAHDFIAASASPRATAC